MVKMAKTATTSKKKKSLLARLVRTIGFFLDFLGIKNSFDDSSLAETRAKGNWSGVYN